MGRTHGLGKTEELSRETDKSCLGRDASRQGGRHSLGYCGNCWCFGVAEKSSVRLGMVRMELEQEGGAGPWSNF